MSRAVFLPGAGGRKHFWQSVAGRLDPQIEPVVLGWPGFGDEPGDENIKGLSDLAGYVLQHIDGPCDLVAQSMGGVVAMLLALQHPGLVRRLVLTGTSGGIDLSRFGADDWRAERQFNVQEQTPAWFNDDRSDLTGQIPSIHTPTLLIWGEADRISPPPAGEYLATLLPNSEFILVPGGHDHPMVHPDAVAALLDRFLLQYDVPIAAWER